jgi:hypothetical protein
MMSQFNLLPVFIRVSLGDGSPAHLYERRVDAGNDSSGDLQYTCKNIYNILPFRKDIVRDFCFPY